MELEHGVSTNVIIIIIKLCTILRNCTFNLLSIYFMLKDNLKAHDLDLIIFFRFLSTGIRNHFESLLFNISILFDFIGF